VLDEPCCSDHLLVLFLQIKNADDDEEDDDDDDEVRNKQQT